MIRKFFNYSVLIFTVLAGQVLQGQGNQKPATDAVKSKPIALTSFKNRNIGNPSLKGDVTVQPNGLDISAAGVDIWGTRDEFNFAYTDRTGDFDIVTRIESLQAANLYTKAGIMAREDLSESCRHIYFQVFSDNNFRNKNNGGYEFQYREVRDSSMKAIYPKKATGIPEFPVSYPNTWIRLKRVANDFTGYYSIDGKSWKPYTTFSLDLPSRIYLGFAVTSHNNAHSVRAKFRNIAELNP
jgi:hypothetical protein